MNTIELTISLLPGDRRTEIEKLRDAMRVTEKRIEELEEPFEFPRDCCPGCACGPLWHQAIDKLHRQAAWLRVLLVRSGTDEHLREAMRLEDDFTEEELDKNCPLGKHREKLLRARITWLNNLVGELHAEVRQLRQERDRQCLGEIHLVGGEWSDG